MRRCASALRLVLLAAALLAPPAAPAIEQPAAPQFDERAALRESQEAIGRRIEDYRFRDTEGRTVSLAGLRGKPLVVQFIYTGCFQVCPATTQFLAQAVREAERVLGKGTFRVATIGFNPPADDPVAMRDFARKFGLSSADWLFLAPETADVPALTRDLGFRYQPTPAGFDHLLQVSILDRDGRVYRQVYGDGFDAPLFVGPLLELVRDAPSSAPPLEALWERTKLLCTVYDPASGRYRINYVVVIEIAVGASVVLGALAFLATELRRRRA